MRYFVQRLLLALPVLLVVSFLVFSMLYLLPGDAALTLAGNNPSEEQLAKIRKELGTDRPFIVQYGKWLGRTLQGDLSDSNQTRSPVTSRLREVAPNSVQLMIFALLLGMAIAIPLGILSAYKQKTLFDRITTAASFGLLAAPGFVIGIVLLFTFAVRLQWLPATVPPSPSVLDKIRGMFLPALTLGLSLVPGVMRLLRTDMITTLQEDFINMAKAKGLSDRRILLKHALRPSSFTLLTVLGINVATLIGNALVVEQLFNLNGLGRMIVTAIFARDTFVVLGGILVVTIAFIATTLAVDILYGVLDPRVRHARKLV